MNDLSDLYQEIIMDHRRNPRNEGLPAEHTHMADGFNPFCGDRVSVAINIENDAIIEVGFTGEGCAISMASASLMTEAVSGKLIDEATASFEGFRALLIDGDGKLPDGVDLGDLEALAGVRAYPTRIKCAILSWHTLKSALDNESASVTTE